MKQIFFVILTGLFIVLMSTIAFAGTWKQDAKGWWWDNGNGTYPTNCWVWIDGNNDGISECYYFGPAGYLFVNTTTPDGYTVDANGAWVVNGIVQTRGNSTNSNNSPLQYNTYVDYLNSKLPKSTSAFERELSTVAGRARLNADPNIVVLNLSPDCEHCFGHGYFECIHCKGEGYINDAECPYCRGEGYQRCIQCGGTGRRRDQIVNYGNTIWVF